MIDLHNIRNFTTDKPDKWNILATPEAFEAFPETHKAQILFLDKTAYKYLFDFIKDAGLTSGGGWDPFAKGNFKQVEKFTDFYHTEESWQALKKWLYKRGMPFQNWVFVLAEGGNNQPMLLTWKMVIKYSSDLFRMGDVMCFDTTLNWCLYFFRKNELFFGKDPVYDPSAVEKEMQELNERKEKYPKFKHPYL